MLFAKVAGSVSGAFQDSEVRRFAQFRVERSGSGSIEMLAFIAPGEEARSPDLAGRCRNECVFKSHAVSGKSVDVGSLDDRVARTAERVIALVIGVEKKDVRLCRSGLYRGTAFPWFLVWLWLPVWLGSRWRKLASLAFVGNVPLVQHCAELLHPLRSSACEIHVLTGIVLQIEELRFATLRRILHLSRPSVIGQQEQPVLCRRHGNFLEP